MNLPLKFATVCVLIISTLILPYVTYDIKPNCYEMMPRLESVQHIN